MGCFRFTDRNWLVFASMHCQRNDKARITIFLCQLLPYETKRDILNSILCKHNCCQLLRFPNCALDGRLVQRLHEIIQHNSNVCGQYQALVDVQVVLGKKLLHSLDDRLVFHLPDLLHPEASRKDRGWKPTQESRSCCKALIYGHNYSRQQFFTQLSNILS